MGLYALVSAKGSPGTTTTAAALATIWPSEPVLADLDPAGGDLLWRARTTDDEPLSTERGLVSLGASVRRGAHEVALEEHLQEISGGVRVLAGLRTAAQVSGLGAAWSQLPAVFKGFADDVLADCGRVVPGSATLPVVGQADAVLFVVRPDVEGIAHLRDRLGGLRDQVGLGGVDGPVAGVAVVTSYRDTHSGPDLQKLLASEGVNARVLGIIADDRKSAEAFRGIGYTRPSRSLLIRSAAELAGRLIDLAENRVAPGALY
jgi:MinD-like ATPase involved in chromosome partitioning or flagellar assembly